MRIKELGTGGIKAVIGFLKGGGSQIQSVLFPKSKFTLAQAKAWIKKHNYTVHETWLVTDVLVGSDYIEFQETLVTPEMEAELLNEPPFEVKNVKKETWEWLFSD
jgi:hypothetical protein